MMINSKIKDKKTIIFDLDETLIHCNESINSPKDFTIKIEFDNGEEMKVFFPLIFK